MATQDAHRHGRARHRQRLAGLAGLAALACAGGAAPATAMAADAPDPEKNSAVLVIDLRTEEDAPGWSAAAFEQSIAAQVTRFGRVRVFDRRRLACNRNDGGCSLDDYADEGLDLVLLGTVSKDRLRYSLHELWTPARVTSGRFSLDDEGGYTQLEQRILRAFNPVLKRGGLLDENAAGLLVNRPDDLPPMNRSLAWRAHGWAGLFWALAGWLSLPIFLCACVLAPSKLRRMRTLRSLRWSSPLMICFAVLAIACLRRPADAPTPAITPELAEQVEMWGWVLDLSGGMLWGFWLLCAAGLVLPRIGGFGRIAHQDLVRLVRAWGLVVLQRLLLYAALYAPFVLLFSWVMDSLEVPRRVATVLLAPIALLLIRYWYRSLMECLTLWADERLVIGPATRENSWHDTVRDYVVGYVRRSGWNLDKRVLDRILFLPGTRRGIRCYGGGLTESRVVIDPALLDLALGETEEDTLIEHEFTWSDWNAGLRLPERAVRSARWRPGVELAERIKEFATAARKRVLKPGFLRRQRRRASTQSDAPRKRLGQAPTLFGRVVPSSDNLVPLLSDTPGDLETVRELLAEQAYWAYPDPDEEHDDTDPSDRDFLFGALVVEIGRIERGENQLFSLAAALDGSEGVSGMLVERIAIVYQRWLSRYPIMLADSYAALNFAGDHLVQYLNYLRGQNTEALSARADRDELAAISRRTFNTLSEEQEEGSDAAYLGASARKRLIWASRFSTAPLVVERGLRVRRIAVVSALVGVAAALGVAVVRAVQYHPTYVETIAEEQRQIEADGEEN